MRRWLTTLVAFALLGATPLLAQEHGEGGGGGLLSINPGLSVWTIVIFLIVLVILSKAAYPKILGAVEAREAHIASLLEQAERDRAEAAALADENRRLVDEARARVQEAFNEARAQGEKMRAEVLADARREHEEMMERARRDIATERDGALDAVRREAVDLSIAAAEKLVQRTMDTEDNRRLVLEYLGQASRPAEA